MYAPDIGDGFNLFSFIIFMLFCWFVYWGIGAIATKIDIRYHKDRCMKLQIAPQECNKQIKYIYGE